MELGTQAWPEVDGSTHLLIPLGATEQHGPHLPLDTDARIAVAIANAAAAESNSVVAPVLAYGASGEHAGFAGTLSIGTEVLHAVLVELVRSASLTFDRVTLVNGHGGNHQGLGSALEQLIAEGHRVTSWSPRIPDGDAHAGRTETSLMLAIAPESVKRELAEPGNTAPLGELITEMRSHGVIGVSPNGVLGDPTGASAEEGRGLLAMLTHDLIRHIA